MNLVLGRINVQVIRSGPNWQFGTVQVYRIQTHTQSACICDAIDVKIYMMLSSPPPQWAPFLLQLIPIFLSSPLRLFLDSEATVSIETTEFMKVVIE